MRPRKTHCKHGHPFNAKNTYLKPDGRHGRLVQKCRRCRANYERRKYARNPALVARRLLSAKTHRLKKKLERLHEDTQHRDHVPGNRGGEPAGPVPA